MGVELKVWTEGNILTASAELKQTFGSQCSRDALRISIEHPVIAYLKKLEGALSPCSSPRSPQKVKDVLYGHCKARVMNESSNTAAKADSMEQITNCVSKSIKVIVPRFPLSTKLDQELKELISNIEEGLGIHQPELCEEGVNGTYFLKNKAGKRIAVFKPEDEQGDTEQNPKSPKSNSDQYVSDVESAPATPEVDVLDSVKKVLFPNGSTSESNDITAKGLVHGEVASREVCSSLLDREGFYGVPMTCAVQIIHSSFGEEPKYGSLQAFVENDGASWDIGRSLFPVKEVHKIGVLDLHIFNTDRHEGNILIKKLEESEDSNGPTYKLIPIDHGYSLPHSLDAAWFDWLTWPQAKKPFDAETLKYIERLNSESDAKLLEEELNIRKECIRTMKISTTLLKKGAKRGLTLFEIGDMVCRRDVSEPSDLELMYEKAQGQLLAAPLVKEMTEETKENLFLEILYKIMDQEVEKKALKRQRHNTV